LNRRQVNEKSLLCFRYHQGELYVIDVSQSVEYDHPHAMEFLRKDCTNITSFFGRRHGVCTMTVKELFDFITDRSISEANVDAYLSKAMQLASTRSEEATTNEQQIDEEVCQALVFFVFVLATACSTCACLNAVSCLLCIQ
jgi:hypothetical protein